jgi:hypothetical protein
MLDLALTGNGRFSTDSGSSHNTVYSDLPAAPPSQLSFPHFSNVFHSGLSGPATYASSGSSFFPQNTPGYCMPDIKPNLGYHGSSEIKPLIGFQPGVDIKPGLNSLYVIFLNVVTAVSLTAKHHIHIDGGTVPRHLLWRLPPAHRTYPIQYHPPLERYTRTRRHSFDGHPTSSRDPLRHRVR